jgi:hypothetical protein
VMRDRHRQLKSLRATLAPSEACEECGHGPNTSVEYEVTWEDDTDDTPTHCPACGRQVVYDIYWTDDPRHPDNRE